MGDIIFATFLIIPLSYGSIMDYKHRIIPNGVCLSVLIVGLLPMILLSHGSNFFVPIWLRIAGVFPAILMLFIAYHKQGIGGGDIKLMAALGFSIGLYTLVPVLFIAAVTGKVWAISRKVKSVPLAVFLWIGCFLVVSIQCCK